MVNLVGYRGVGPAKSGKYYDLSTAKGRAELRALVSKRDTGQDVLTGQILDACEDALDQMRPALEKAMAVLNPASGFLRKQGVKMERHLESVREEIREALRN